MTHDDPYGGAHGFSRRKALLGMTAMVTVGLSAKDVGASSFGDDILRTFGHGAVFGSLEQVSSVRGTRRGAVFSGRTWRVRPSSSTCRILAEPRASSIFGPRAGCRCACLVKFRVTRSWASADTS